MADLAINKKGVPSLTARRVRVNDCDVSSTSIKTASHSVSQSSSPSRITNGMATGKVPLLAHQASTTKTTLESDQTKNIQDIPEHQIVGGNHQRLCVKTTAVGDDEKKRRRSNRYDSSESSDSGVTSLACSDASSWSSSSDITEPVSPASPSSSQPSPLCQPTSDINNSSHFDSVPLERNDQPIDCEEKAVVHSGCDKQTAVESSCHSNILKSPFTNLKRCRRHSDSASTDLLHHQKVEAFTDCNKRVRRSSGEWVSNTTTDTQKNNPGLEGRPSVTLNGFPFNLKWLNLFSRNNISHLPSVETRKSRKQSLVNNLRQSWPIPKRSHKKSGQMKITEYFSSQIKQRWSFSKPLVTENRDINLPASSISGNLCLPLSRVAIVSVSQEDHVNEDCNFNSPSVIPVDCKGPLNIKSIFPTETSGSVPVRFPLDETKAYSKNDTILPNDTDEVYCRWLHCTSRLVSGQSLLEHIQNAHVASQASVPSSHPSWTSNDRVVSVASSDNSIEQYSCQWAGCKVQGRISSSRAWLERHVLLHGGHKPFRCIVDTCEQRFNSQAALQRHVNAHFNQESTQSGNSHGLKRENAPAKVMRRNSKKLKHRRSKVSPARLFDYFDSGIMERLRHQLLTSQTNHSRIGLSLLSSNLTVSSQVIARRYDATGKARVLVRWLPENLLPDQWLLEEEVVAHRSVSFRNLNTAVRIELHQTFVQPSSTGGVLKQRRKR